MEELKKKVQELANIAATLPDNLQAVCFELLLRHHLGSGPPLPSPQPPASRKQEVGEAVNGDDALPPSTQDDISDSDIHAKARRFLQQNGLSIDHVNNLFYKEGDEIRTLYEDLKTTVMADGQIRIALLQALTHALSTGVFEAEVEAVRTEAKDRKCYDGSNYSANFRNSGDFFDFEKWDTSVKTVRLSPAGKKQLATVVKELQ